MKPKLFMLVNILLLSGCSLFGTNQDTTQHVKHADAVNTYNQVFSWKVIILIVIISLLVPSWATWIKIFRWMFRRK